MSSTPIYVVMSQRIIITEKPPEPLMAFSDYPSAWAYAVSIFRPVWGSNTNPRDLVFLIAMNPVAAATATTTGTTT